MDGGKKKRETLLVFIVGIVLILIVLSVFALLSSSVMRLLGFAYESTGSFIWYFIVASVVSYPLNLAGEALSETLFNFEEMPRKMTVGLYVLFDAATTFCGFSLVDYFMTSVSANTFSLLVLALVFALLGAGDAGKKESGKTGKKA